MTNQSDRQQSCRNVTGTSLCYEGDWHALWDVAGIPVGEYESRMLAYINQALNTTYTELNGAMAAYAIAQGVSNWNQLGTFTPGPYPFPGASQAFDFSGPTGATALAGNPLVFSRGTNATMFRSGDAWLVFAPNNAILWSEDFSNATWAKTGTVSTTLSSATPVQGFSTIFEYNQGATATGAEYVQNQFTAVAGQKYTESFYIRKGGANPVTTVDIKFGSGAVWAGGIVPGATFNLDTGAVTNITGTVDATTNVLLPDGSRVLSVTATAVAAGSPTCRIYSLTANGTFLISGVQCELGPYVQAYNKTQGTLYYSPRFDTNPSTLTPRGLLYEQARTNILIYSNDFNNAIWAKTDSTITSNSTISPEGIQNMDMLTEGTAGNAIITVQSAPYTAGSIVTNSIYLKRGNTDWCRVRVVDLSGTDGAQVWVNLATGVLGTLAAQGAGTNNSATITALPNGIYRVTLSSLLNGSATVAQFQNVSAAADGSAARVNNSTRYVYGAQVEAASNPTSYIPTFGATATRGTETETFDASTLFNAAQGTIYTEFEIDPSLAGVDVRPFSFTDGTTNNRIHILRNTSNGINAVATSGGVSSGAISLPGPYTSGIIKVAMTYTDGGTYQMAINGVLSSAVAMVSPIGITTGHFSMPTFLTGRGPYWNRKFAYYPTKKTNAEIQAMTV